MSEWISLKDNEPPIKQSVLITDGKMVSVAYWLFRCRIDNSPSWLAEGIDGEEWGWWIDDSKPTHWMPLPELPLVP